MGSGQGPSMKRKERERLFYSHEVGQRFLNELSEQNMVLQIIFMEQIERLTSLRQQAINASNIQSSQPANSPPPDDPPGISPRHPGQTLGDAEVERPPNSGSVSSSVKTSPNQGGSAP